MQTYKVKKHYNNHASSSSVFHPEIRSDYGFLCNAYERTYFHRYCIQNNSTVSSKECIKVSLAFLETRTWALSPWQDGKKAVAKGHVTKPSLLTSLLLQREETGGHMGSRLVVNPWTELDPNFHIRLCNVEPGTFIRSYMTPLCVQDSQGSHVFILVISS